MTATIQTLLLFLAVLVVVAVAARRLNTAPSILLVIAGIGLALTPGLPRIELAPELVLLGILPLLIYSAGVAMSWREFRFNLRPITLLAFGCVVFTTCAVAGAVHWLLGMPLAVGFVLGAIVAPPDVVAPLAIARRLGLPRRHMVEVIAIHADLASDELGKATFDPRVMAVMTKVPRHHFVPAQLALHAYQDMPLPIGFDKTTSQPFIVALMTDLLSPQPQETVLEIGTGLGYQAAILAELAARVWSVEIVEECAAGAEVRLRRLGRTNVGIRVGDGSRGWAEHAPFDKILVAAAAERVPPALLEQLKPGGRLVMPRGPEEAQHLIVMDKDPSGYPTSRVSIPVRFGRLETVM